MAPQDIFQHEAILETLDWTQFDPIRKEFDYYSVPEFEKNTQTFDEISIYYGKKHPGIYASEDELLKNEDVIKVGWTSNANVNMMGRPKLKSTLNITDFNVEDKIRKGEILISPFFRYTGQKDGYRTNITNPRGLHVLLFDKSLGAAQGDPGAIICNQSNSENTSLKFGEGYFEGANMTTEPSVQVVEVSKLAELLKANQAPVFDTEKFLSEQTELIKANQALSTEKDELIKANQALETERDQLKDDLVKANQASQGKIAELQKTIEDNKAAVEAERVELFKANQDRYWAELSEATQEKFTDRKEELYDLVKANQLLQDISKFVAGIPVPKFTTAQGATDVKELSATDMNNKELYDAYARLSATTKNVNYTEGI
ncbi:MAG: hypothetical protein WCS17_04980 [Prevotella sp.]